MDTYHLLGLGPGFIRESLLLWGLFAIVLLYLARSHAHLLLLSMMRVMTRGLRVLAALFWRMRKRLQVIQTEMLVSALREEVERQLQRDFKSLAKTVHRELSEFPTLHREVNALVARIEQDYEASLEIPPEPPAWLGAVDAVKQNASGSGPALAEILNGMHSTLARASSDALEEYRYASRKRHLLLRHTAPYWRKVVAKLQHMEKLISGLSDQSLVTDKHMGQFKQLRSEAPQPGMSTQLRFMARFVLSVLLLSGFVILAVSEAALLHVPMVRLLGEPMRVFAWPLSAIGAWVFVGTPVLLGGMLLELGQFTQLMPSLGALPDRLRIQLRVVLMILIVMVLGLVGSLVALGTPLPGNGTMGYFSLFTMVALSLLSSLLLLGAEMPLEVALRSGRQVAMSLFVGLLGMLALLLRLGSWVSHLGGGFLVRLYDLAIFLPLIIDEAWAARRQRHAAMSAERLES